MIISITFNRIDTNALSELPESDFDIQFLQLLKRSKTALLLMLTPINVILSDQAVIDPAKVFATSYQA